MARVPEIVVRTAAVGVADRVKRLERIVTNDRIARQTRIRVSHLIEALEDAMPLVAEADQFLVLYDDGGEE